MDQYTKLVTQRLNSKIPKRSIGLRFQQDGIEYLHPTKGWKRVSYRRTGIRLTEISK